MTKKELSDLLTQVLILPKENEYVEFKSNYQKPEDIGERLSALANGSALLGQQYAYLIFGIEDKSRKVIGTTFSVANEKIGNDELENWLVQRLNPRIDFRIYEFEFQDKRIVLFHIPAAQGQPVSFKHIDYIRIGSLTRKLEDFPEKERKLWQKNSSEYELEYALQGVSSADVVALLDTQAVFDLLLKQPYPTTQAGVISKMIDEKLIVRSNGYYHITNLGALLFAKNLKDFGLERKAPRVIKYKGKGKMYTEKDQIGQYGYGNGFQRLLNYISGLLPSNEIIELATRKDVQMYPPLAVRELVANAIIHQDFREKGTFLTIEIYDGRVEISNPGLPMVEPIRFIDGYNARNSLLANAMRRMNFCEEKGSGIDKVIFEVEIFQLPAPDFRTTPNQTIAILYAHQDLNEMNRKDKIRATYQHCCLMHVTDQKMTNKTLRERFKIEEKNASIVSRIIKDTLEDELIKLQNIDNKSRKFVDYIPFWA
jgi:ATP-dependent DNA helicase RecG